MANDGSDACPEGWRGVDCGVCASAAACPEKILPSGRRVKPVGCTSSCLVPTREETAEPSPFGAGWDDGKVFSCACGGDARTDPFCDYQKDTTFLFHMTADANGDGDGDGDGGSGSGSKEPPLRMRVKEYGGIPNMDREGVGDWKYRYAFAPVWDANFTGCEWQVTSCPDPLPSAETCAVYTCPAGRVACPPEDLPRCPGRNALGCGRGPENSTGSYWQHPCNPLVTPQDKGMTFWCSLNRTAGSGSPGDGSHLCYWTQPGVIPSFAVTCHVGNCLYEPSATLADACPVDFTPAAFWTGDLITRVSMFCVAGALVAAAGLYVRAESRSLYAGKTAAQALEEAANAPPRSPDRPRSRHVRTPSSVLGPRGRGPGTTDDVVVCDAAPTRRARVLSWENVWVYATLITPSRPSGVIRRILRGVSGFAGPGPAPARGADGIGDESSGSGLFAILGPSGAGKSTLLDYLSSRTPKGQVAHGRVRVDGRLVDRREMRHISGYVPQDDVLPGTSTVWEHLLFNAVLRLPDKTDNADLYRCAAGWMRELGLVKVADSLIGDQFTRGLSGGEKRRVSIAAELLTDPGIMFLDEPTTGLDSSNAAKVVDILAGLGRVGVTVVMSIHQPRPDIFRLLDRVLVMSGTGRAVYSGPSAAAEAHFASLPYAPRRPDDVHVADYVLDTVLRSSEEDVARMIDDFEASDVARGNEAHVRDLTRAAEEEDADMDREDSAYRRGTAAAMTAGFEPLRRRNASAAEETYVAPFGKQIRLLCGRLLRKLGRHPFLLAVHFAAAFATALGVGAVFFRVGSNQGGIQNRMGALFFVLLYLTLMSLSSLPVWREDRLLFLRERASGVYGTNAYFASTLLFDILPMRVLPPFFFGLVTYGMIGLNEGTEYSLANFVACLVITNVCATCMCMAIGAAAKSVAVANAVASLCFLVAILFGGFLLNKDHIPGYARWIARLSFVNYGYEALVVNEFARNPRTFTLTSAWNSTKLPDEVPVPGEKVLSTFGFHADRVAPDLWAVSLEAAIFALLSYVLLRNAEHGPWRALLDWLGNRNVRRENTLVAARARARASAVPRGTPRGTSSRWDPTAPL